MRRVIEWLLVSVGTGNAIGVAVVFARFQLEPGDSIWRFFPIPGFYFIEIIIVALLAPVVVWQFERELSNSTLWINFLAVGSGALLGFSILGMWTIGFPLMPTPILYFLALVSITSRNNQPIWAKLGIFIGGIFLQIAGMLSIIYLTLE